MLALNTSGKSKAYSTQLKYGFLFSLVYFIAISDFTSVNIAGGNFRLLWLALPLVYFFIPRGREPKWPFVFASFLCLMHLMAAIASDSKLQGVFFSFWIFFNYIFFFRTAFLITLKLGDDIWKVVLLGGRVQVVFGILFVFFGLHERAQFLYFEPSYLAIGLVPYVFTIFFWVEKKSLDFFLLFSLVAFNQSANLMLAIAIASFFWLFVNKRIWQSLLGFFFVLISAYVAFLFALSNPASPNHAVASWLSDNGVSAELVTAILSRGGNRVPRMEAAFEILEEGNWWVGVGPGSYIEMTKVRDFGHISGAVAYLDPAGLPAVNILLESALNAGIFSTICMVIFYLYCLRLAAVEVKNFRERSLILGAMLAFGLMMMFESSYLRAYIWIAFGVFVSRAHRFRITEEAH